MVVPTSFNVAPQQKESRTFFAFVNWVAIHWHTREKKTATTTSNMRASVCDGESKTLLVSASAAAVGSVAVAYVLQSYFKRRHLQRKIDQFQAKEVKNRQQIEQENDIDDQLCEKITSMPFKELVRRLQRNELSAVNVCKAFQKKALQSTNQTNAVTEFIMNAEAKAAALDSKEKKGPLHGIPFSVKECFFLTGTETTAGFSQYLGKHLDKQTAAIVEFMERLGAVPFVKTNIPQSMLAFDSRNPVYGITSNPNNTKRSPGGSSSGEGALVGGKACLVGIGNDIGGSLRIPVSILQLPP